MSNAVAAAPPAARPATAPATRPTDPDLYAWWRADHASGDSLDDLSGHRHPAKPLKGKLKIETIDHRLAVRISADASPLSAGNDSGFDFSNDFTVAMRVRIANESDDATLISKRAANGADGWAIVHGIGGIGGVGFVAAPRVAVPTPCKATSDWVHVAVTFQQKEFLLYIDGKAIGVMELPRVPASSREALLFGSLPGGVHGMDGWLDDIRVYHRGLTASDVEALAAGKEPASPYTPLTPAEEKLVRDTIKELGSDSFQRRERAAAKLKSMGRKIFPLLRQYRDSEDLEVGLRISTILGELPRGEDGK